MNGHPRIVLYDGVCGMCNRFVQVLLDLDRDGRFAYAPLQGETADALRAEHPDIGTEIDTIVYVEEGAVHQRSDALLRIARQLRFPWRVAVIGRILPRPLRDVLYRFVAERRYAWFGKYDTCRIPRAEEAERFLA